MKIGVGTKSVRKINSVKRVLEQILPNEVIEVFPYTSRSNVPETPWDKETYDGARNRALDCKENIEDLDYYIGLESGLVERYGQLYEEAWCCLLTRDNKEYFGYSSGLKLPDFIIKKMDDLKMAHSDVMDVLDKEEKRSNNDDTWGTYSNKMIIRDISLEEAVRNALVQAFAPKDSYYHK